LTTEAEASSSLRDRLVSKARVESVAAGGGAAVAVGGVAAASGGYFPTSWGWAAVAFAWAAAMVLLLHADTDAGWLDVAFWSLVALFVGWIWLSATWSQSAPSSVLEGERGLVALAGVGAALLVVSRRTVEQLLAGVAVAITLIAAYGLATRLFPSKLGTFDPIAQYRLETPIGYWNALGIFSAIGALLSFAFAARARTVATRAVAGAALAFVLPTIYFTFSRGAWVALGIGLAGAVLLDPRRLQLVVALLALAPVPALEIWLGSREDALTHKRADLAAAVHDGKRYAFVVVAAAVATAAIAAGLALFERRLTVSRAVRLGFGGVVAAAIVAALIAVFATYGGPARIAERGWDSFKSAPAPTGQNLNKRLFSFAGNGRVDLWRAAWHDHEAHPTLGSGAGTYQEWWYRHRPYDFQVRDAHSLYAETLAELGPIGLALLGLALLVPIGAALLARRHPLVPAAFGTYLAYLAHAGVDWDWEVTAVTLAALLGGVALVAAARARGPRPLAGVLRAALAALAVAVGALAFVVLVGNLKLARADDATERGDWQRAAARARSAGDWAPWSSEALQALGEAQLKQGQTAAAAATFRRAVRKDPQNSDLWYDLHLAANGRESDHAFAVAVRLNPFGFDAKDRRAVLGRSAG
jgi:O-antigen ligase